MHPALYEAMFRLPIDVHFAQDDTETGLRSSFDALSAALGGDDETRTGRMRPEHRPHRIAALASRFTT